MEAFLYPFGMLALGISIVCLALFLFGEYRSIFFRNPQLTMSTEVFAYLARLGGLGYVGAVLMIAGTILILVACVMIVVLVGAVLSGHSIGIVAR